MSRDTNERTAARSALGSPIGLPGSERAQRTRLLNRFGLGFGFFNMGFVPLLLFLSTTTAAAITLLTTSLMLLSPLVLRWTGSLRASAHLFIGAVLLLFGGVSIELGGLSSPTLPILVLVPILAVFLLGRSAGFLWSAAAVITIAAFSAVEHLGAPLAPSVEAAWMPFFRTMATGTIVGVSLIFVLQYDDTKNNALDAVRKSYLRMVEMIRRLNETSTALSRSAEEFLGTEIDAQAESAEPPPPSAASPHPDDGLTQKMLSTASSSRAMIGRVDTSIRGMIAQYQSISRRIHELYLQSGNIAELVEAIDTISDRLDLMALNTGIEAAHAGTEGKRFRLLADDMRRLAERVVGETNRIKKAIRAVEQHTRAALDASMAGQALTDEGVTQIEAMSRTFDDMHRLIERTADASERITNDTIRQLTAIHNLVTESLGEHQQGR